MSTIIKVRCTDQVLTFENTPVIASGGLEEDFVSFAFCSKWDGLVKTAVFWRSEEEVYHVLLDEADSCPIPREVLAVEGVIYFGVFGVNEAGKQRTSEVLRYNIAKGAITEGTKPTDPTPDIYTQILGEFLRYENEINAKLDDFAQSWAEYQAAMNQARTDHEEAVARWQEDLETAVSETQDAYESRMNQEWENFKTGGDFVLKVDYEKDQEEQEQAMTTLEERVGSPESLAALAVLVGLDSTASVVEVIEAVKALTDQAKETADAGVKFACGTYTGTGTSGSSNPCSITLGFEPKLLIVDDIGLSSDSKYGASMIAVFTGLTNSYTNQKAATRSVQGYTDSLGGLYLENENSYLFFKFDGTKLYWHYTRSSVGTDLPILRQCNYSSHTFLFRAFG